MTVFPIADEDLLEKLLLLERTVRVVAAQRDAAVKRAASLEAENKRLRNALPRPGRYSRETSVDTAVKPLPMGFGRL